MPANVNIITLELAIPVIIKNNAPIKIASVDVSQMEPGINPKNASNQETP